MPSERPWTPGPWKLELLPESALISAPDVPNDEQLFEVGFGPECRAEQIANVRLIAASTELYEALEGLRNAVVRQGASRGDESTDEVWAENLTLVFAALDTAHAALLKANPEVKDAR